MFHDISLIGLHLVVEPRLYFLAVRTSQGLTESETILSIFVAQLSPSRQIHVLDFMLKYKTIASLFINIIFISYSMTVSWFERGHAVA
jgi:hypothetical protein